MGAAGVVESSPAERAQGEEQTQPGAEWEGAACGPPCLRSLPCPTEPASPGPQHLSGTCSWPLARPLNTHSRQGLEAVTWRSPPARCQHSISPPQRPAHTYKVYQTQPLPCPGTHHLTRSMGNHRNQDGSRKPAETHLRGPAQPLRPGTPLSTSSPGRNCQPSPDL